MPQFCDFIFFFGIDQGDYFDFTKDLHLIKEVTLVEVRRTNLLVVVIFDDDRDGNLGV